MEGVMVIDQLGRRPSGWLQSGRSTDATGSNCDIRLSYYWPLNHRI